MAEAVENLSELVYDNRKPAGAPNKWIDQSIEQDGLQLGIASAKHALAYQTLRTNPLNA